MCIQQKQKMTPPFNFQGESFGFISKLELFHSAKQRIEDIRNVSSSTSKMRIHLVPRSKTLMRNLKCILNML